MNEIWSIKLKKLLIKIGERAQNYVINERYEIWNDMNCNFLGLKNSQ
jgi:hypothetical protein